MLSSREGSVTASETDLPWTLRPKGDLSFAALDQQPRRLGITWRDLTVQAVAADATIHDNFTSQYNIANKLRDARRKPPLKTILDRSHGCVKPGEMLLVLGRPGSGCTTLLSVLANRRNGYASVEGDVHYGSLPAADAGKYQGQIVMNTEDELFFPSLTVDQTMDFATRLKVPANASRDPEELRRDTRDFLLESMGISHTHTTKLGNEFIRGVSGGERKRVSIVECMATRGSVFCWDNSTRGLDASNALEWARTVRAMTDVLGLASIATLYQAGNGIYHLFDKVLVLDGGKQIFYGPMEEARPFMEFLGFVCPEGANVADYLTGVTVPTERRIRPGWEPFFPRTAHAVKVEYEASSIFYNMQIEYDYPTSELARENTRLFQEAVDAEKHSQLPSSSPLTVSFSAQVKACVFRQYQIVWGDKATFIVKQVFTAMQALIMGSLFYNAPANSSGLFVKSGALFFSLLYNALLSMTEVGDSFRGRPILVKHKLFGFYHPAAFCIAQITADIPLILFQVSIFGIILYFMVGFTATAASFFTYWVILVAATMVMTALFRAIGAGFERFDGAAKLAGLSILSTMLYTGYMIQKPQMHPWFVWIFWINPVAYAFDALLSNEFHGKIIDCVGNSLVPNGPGYFDPEYQSCAGVTGSTQGQTWLTGDQYLGALTYSHTHIWRNLGILVAFWALFVMLTVVFTSRWRAASEGGSTLLIPRERSKLFSGPCDEENRAAVTEKTVSNSAGYPRNAGEQALIRNTSLFTWKNLSYTVKTPEGERLLLDNVQGWVKPGMLGALMGSSGAGKTTLLDVLAQRKTEGTIRGSILVDGRPLPISFQRSAGYCEQLDVHEPYATVREALEFSALLRQRRDVPREEKLRYVDTIIDLLELHDLADTLIGEPGAGLTIEQRKRVTIGVELVAKPSILIFLDEPTSGLDGQSAYNTVRFLRKLADAGQAVLVTIHQPSAQVFSFFDTLLLLTGGGKTVYFGEIGEGGRTVRGYFERYGAQCPEETNLAEHMIDVVSGSLSQGKDWSEVWLTSPEHEAVTRELDYIIAAAASSPPRTVDDGHEYAMPLWEQLKLVTQRTSLSVYRNTDYVNNKIALHIFGSLFNGFSFWKIGNSVNDLQLRLFTVFNFIFVAPGIINHMQPLFIQRRNIFETREKKSKMYSWVAFVAAIIVSEIPYLCICAVLYFACWYFTVGFPHEASRAGSTFFVMLMFEFVYTGIGQFEAAWAPNELFAALVNPVVIGILISFCGVLVPYAQIQPFWRHWLYWINPLNYLTGSILVFSIWDTDVTCTQEELALFDPANGTTCAEYLAGYMRGMGRGAKLLNPEATIRCEVCPYSSGSTYLQGLNLNEYYYGWRDAGIVVIFALSSYALVFLLMKLRTKRSKKAE